MRDVCLGLALALGCAACGDDRPLPPDAARPLDGAIDALPDAAIDAPVDAAIDAPADAMPCTEGAVRCNGTGFDTCSEGAWVYRDCAAGTSCVPMGDMIVCDFT